jgi:hypothetical protein
MATIAGEQVDLTPTEGMKEEAQRYRDWKADGEAGGTDVAARRAGQILSGDELSPDTVITMAAWFARHEVAIQARLGRMRRRIESRHCRIDKWKRLNCSILK